MGEIFHRFITLRQDTIILRQDFIDMFIVWVVAWCFGDFRRIGSLGIGFTAAELVLFRRAAGARLVTTGLLWGL